MDSCLLIGATLKKSYNKLRKRNKANMSDEDYEKCLEKMLRVFFAAVVKKAPYLMSLICTQVTALSYNPTETFDVKDIK